jgi:2-polyprenyl-3-methyl-5-hydroxy-6-metoxy-1,4-benzoquinol methylase
MDIRAHWEQVYQTKSSVEVSWYQPKPAVSLDFIAQWNLPLNARIIDVGGGDSTLADHLLEKGYSNITVLDISETAIQKAKQRLGKKATLVHWMITNVINLHS